MRHPTFFPALFVLIWGLLACGNAADDEERAAPSEGTAADPIALRQAYRQHLSELADTLPARQLVEPGKLYPVDEALTDTAFFVFREELREAVAERDILSVLSRVADDVAGPEGERGLEAFTARWGLDTESGIQESDLWAVLARTLGEGGAFAESGTVFRAPYPYATFPTDTFDPEQFGAVTGAGVRMRASPSLNSAILTLISNDIVPVLEVGTEAQTIGGETYPWVKLRSLDDQEGFVWGKYVWHNGKFQVDFARTDGQWQLVRLAPGS